MRVESSDRDEAAAAGLLTLNSQLSTVAPPLALQPSFVERELLSRSFQRLTNGDPGAPDIDRQELALRALETLQGAPATTGSPGDTLRQIGLDRRRVGSALALTEGRFAGMEFVTVRGRGGVIRRQQFRAGSSEGPSLHLSLLDVGAGFDRFDDLSAEERSWAGAMRGMRRLELGGQKLALAGGRAELGLLELADGGARARRTSLGFQNERWSVRALSQRTDETFQRLGDLAEADRKLFGKERGIARDALDLGFAFSGGRKLSASSLALQAGSGSAQLRQFEYLGGPNLQLQLNMGRVDPRFDRIGDLPEADKKILAPQAGMSWSDLSMKLNPTRWLTTENQWYRGTSLETGRQSAQLRNLWTFQFAPRSKLILLRHLVDLPSAGEGRRRALTQSARLEQWLTRSLFFTGFHEAVRNAVSDGPDSDGERMALHLNTAPGRPLQWSADYGTTERPDGMSERSLQWTLGLPLRKGLALQARGDRREADGGQGQQTLALGVTGQMARDWNLALTLSTADPLQGPGTRDLGLRLTFAGLRDTPHFRETRLVFGVGDTQGLASAVPVSKKTPQAPASSGPPARRVRSVNLESKLRGQPVSIGYSAAAGTAGGFTYRLATDPKRKLQVEAVREVRDLGRTSLVARQRYAFQARIGRASQVAASYETNPEQSPGKLLLGHTQTKIEAQTMIGGLNLKASVAEDKDCWKGTESRLTSLGIAGNLGVENTVHLSYTGRTGSDPALPSSIVRLEYDRKPDEVLLVALRAEWRGWEGKRSDELAWQLDLKAMF